MALDPRYIYRRGIITCSGPALPHYAPVMAILVTFGPRRVRWDVEFHTGRSGTTTLQIGFVDVEDRDGFVAIQYVLSLPR